MIFQVNDGIGQTFGIHDYEEEDQLHVTTIQPAFSHGGGFAIIADLVDVSRSWEKLQIAIEEGKNGKPLDSWELGDHTAYASYEEMCAWLFQKFEEFKTHAHRINEFVYVGNASGWHRTDAEKTVAWTIEREQKGWALWGWDEEKYSAVRYGHFSNPSDRDEISRIRHQVSAYYRRSDEDDEKPLELDDFDRMHNNLKKFLQKDEVQKVYGRGMD